MGSGRGTLEAREAARLAAYEAELDAGHLVEHATYVVDVRSARRQRYAWLATGVTAAVLLAGPLWGALTEGTARAEGSAPPPATVGGGAAPQPLEAGDPVPQEPSGTGDTDHLDPRVRRAVDRAVAAASASGVELRVTSGWRSRAHQQQLFDEAVAKYGSQRKASRWVLPPSRSAHVQGEAVDMGPRSGAAWLEEHGVTYGLCRRYANEPWHFELLAPAKGQPCPAMEPHA